MLSILRWYRVVAVIVLTIAVFFVVLGGGCIFLGVRVRFLGIWSVLFLFASED